MSTWGGLHFFISIDALVSFGIDISPEDLQNMPGKPQQRVLRHDDGLLVRATSFPCVPLLLSTLKATGNQLHLFSSWRPKLLHDVVTLFGWQPIVTDLRALRTSPGPPDRSLFSLANLDCDPSWYAHSVVLVTDPSAWHPHMAPILFPVRHTTVPGSIQDGRSGASATTDGAAEAVKHSMELLFALCRCVTLAEWRVRVPGTTVAAANALSTANVFSCCRFYVPPHLFSHGLALCLATHGAVITSHEADATHIVFETSQEFSERVAQENEEEDGADTTSTSAITSSSDDDSMSTVSSSRDTSPASAPVSASPAPLKSTAPALPSHTATQRPCPSKRCPSSPPASPTTDTPAQSGQEGPQAPISSSLNTRAQLVTRSWVDGCCRALRLLPVPAPVEAVLPAGSSPLNELLRTTGVLLTALLPPLDARPLPLAQFKDICKAYQFPTDRLSGAVDAETFGKLSALFKGVALVRQIAAPKTPAVAPGRGGGAAALPPTMMVLCRSERKRDRDAVAEHLKLQATQFAFSLEAAAKALRASRVVETGTQTCRPRFAHAGVNTDACLPAEPAAVHSGDALGVEARTKAATEGPAVVDTLTSSVKHPPADAPTEAADAPASPVTNAEGEETLGVDEDEWKTHLKNAEGKLLKSVPATCLADSEGGDGPGTGVVSGDTGALEETQAQMEGHQSGAAAGQMTSRPSVDNASPPQHVTDNPPPAVSSAPISIFNAPPMHLIFPDPRSVSSANGAWSDSVFASPPADPSPRSAAPASAASSIFPMPEMMTSNMSTPVYADAPAFTPFSGAVAQSLGDAPSGQCAIDVSALSAQRRRDFFQYLQLMPMFSAFSSSACVEEDFSHDRVRCLFTSAKEASDFLKLKFIDFGGMEHPIVALPSDEADARAQDVAPARPAKQSSLSLSSMRSFQVDDAAAASFYAALAAEPPPASSHAAAKPPGRVAGATQPTTAARAAAPPPAPYSPSSAEGRAEAKGKPSHKSQSPPPPTASRGPSASAVGGGSTDRKAPTAEERGGNVRERHDARDEIANGRHESHRLGPRDMTRRVPDRHGRRRHSRSRSPERRDRLRDAARKRDRDEERDGGGHHRGRGAHSSNPSRRHS